MNKTCRRLKDNLPVKQPSNPTSKDLSILLAVSPGRHNMLVATNYALYLKNKKKSKKNRRRENREQSNSKKSSKKKRLKKLLKSLLVNTSKHYDNENHSPTNLHSKRPLTEASLVQKKYESRCTHNHENPNHDDTSSETSSECGSIKTKSKSQFKSPLFKRHYSRRRHSNNSISLPLSTSHDENDDELSVHSCPLSYINPPIETQLIVSN